LGVDVSDRWPRGRKAELARVLKCSETAVQNYIKNPDIVFSPTSTDLQVAVAILVYQRDRMGGRSPERTAHAVGAGEQQLSIGEIERQTKIEDLRKKRRENDEAERRLIPVQEIESVLSVIMRGITSGLEALGIELATELASQDDETEVQIRLDEAVQDKLEGLYALHARHDSTANVEPTGD
jgi:hypothetical protein